MGREGRKGPKWRRWKGGRKEIREKKWRERGST